MHKLLSHAALLFTVLFWGMSFVSTKIILNTGFPPLTLACLRFVIASSILFPVVKISQPQAPLSRKYLIRMILGGLVGITTYFYFETNGIRLTTASNAALIIATIPMFTLIAEAIVFKHRIHLVQVAGILLSLIGVYLLISPSSHPEADSGRMLGNLLMLGACISWVTYIVMSKKLREAYSGLTLTAYNSLFGTLFLLPLSVLEHRSWMPIEAHVLPHILYLSIICSAGCYFLYLYALASLKPTATASYINLIPLVGALGGVIVLKDVVVLTQAIGGCTIITGVVLLNIYPGKNRKITFQNPA